MKRVTPQESLGNLFEHMGALLDVSGRSSGRLFRQRMEKRLLKHAPPMNPSFGEDLGKTYSELQRDYDRWARNPHF